MVEELSQELTSVVAVVCSTADGQTIETLVDAASGEHFKFEDPILCEDAVAIIFFSRRFHSSASLALAN